MRSTPAKNKPAVVYVLSALAWLAAAGVGLAAIYYLFQAVVGIYIVTGGAEKGTAGVLQYGSVLLGAVAWLAAIVFLGEYTLKHPGERGMWKRFAWIFGVEAVIILIGAFVV